MHRNKVWIFLCSFLISGLLSAQNKKTKKAIFDSIYQCENRISQNNFLLKNKKFASAEPLLLQVNNDKNEFGVLQIGKRKRRSYLYFKLLVNNTCLKDRDVMELYLENGTIITLKNQFAVNCDGNFVKKIRRKDRKVILNNRIVSMRLHTFNKDYTFLTKEADYISICNNIQCIQKYKIKK